MFINLKKFFFVSSTLVFGVHDAWLRCVLECPFPGKPCTKHWFWEGRTLAADSLLVLMAVAVERLLIVKDFKDLDGYPFYEERVFEIEGEMALLVISL